MVRGTLQQVMKHSTGVNTQPLESILFYNSTLVNAQQ